MTDVRGMSLRVKGGGATASEVRDALVREAEKFCAGEWTVEGWGDVDVRPLISNGLGEVIAWRGEAECFLVSADARKREWFDALDTIDSDPVWEHLDPPRYRRRGYRPEES